MKPLYILWTAAVLVGSLSAYAKNDGVGNSTGNHGTIGGEGKEFRSNANPPESSTDPKVQKELNQKQDQDQAANPKSDKSHNPNNTL